MYTPEQLQRWREIWDDPRELILRLFIEDYFNRLRPVGALLDEQLELLEALLTYHWIISLKCRQAGHSTLINLFLLVKTYTARHPRQALSLIHDEATFERFRRILRVAWENLPRALRSPLAVDNDGLTQFSHNGAAMHRRLAGATGQGRGGTFSDVYATEMPKWPSRSTARRSADRVDASRQTWSSVLQTVHDPEAHIITESTGGGPSGLFYEIFQLSMNPKSKWHLVFTPWTSVPRFRRELSDVQKRDLEQELDEDEQSLMQHHRVSLEQIAWRRDKMFDEGLTVGEFLREYPTAPTDPFRADSYLWFNQDALAVQAKNAKIVPKTDKQFVPPEPGKRYLIAADTSGGTGGDEASVKVIREDLVECASWDTNLIDVEGQADQVARYSLLYGQGQRPPVLIEANRFGEDVIAACDRRGLNTYKRGGKDFWTTGRMSGDLKRKVYVHARLMVNAHLCTINDLPTVVQLQSIVEKVDGRIEAPGNAKRDPPIGHDDRADAFALGLWLANELGWRATPESVDSERDRVGRILQMTRRAGIA